MTKPLFSNIDNSFTDNLPADPVLKNHIRQVLGAAYSYVNPSPSSAPSLIHASQEVGALLGLSKEELASQAFLEVVSGYEVYSGTKPYAMCYGGHQFGHWAGQLGDGRAINLFETVNDGKRWALQIKGAGLTPYSRSADGLAVLRSSIREYLCSEAMFHLGVPTTRALSLALSGDQVMRDMLYDGNPEYEKGAIVCRVAPSFIRFGNFQIFAARRDTENLKRLADYTIQYFFPEIDISDPDRYILFFKSVTERTLEMILHWQRVGFVHGVMNTDNLSILGLTIDYGPYGWLDDYDTNWTPNTTDRQNRRYRYGQQANVALWNLAQLANAIFPLINKQEPLVEILEWYKTSYANRHFEMMGSKIGLDSLEEGDMKLIQSLEKLLESVETDMTIFFRNLANYSNGKDYNDWETKVEPILDAFYETEQLTEAIRSNWIEWIDQYLIRLAKNTSLDQDRQKAMNLVNPKYVLRNYIAQLVIDEADKGNHDLLLEVFEMLKKPYDEQPEYANWFSKRPEWARNKVGCSMLSCSS